MKSIKLLTIGLLFAGTTFFSSCSKEGCTDRDSVNYDSTAKTSDGSCRYEGSTVIWFGESTANQLINEGTSTLTYYVDDQIVGSSSSAIYWDSRPSCGQNASITVTKDLGAAKNKTYTYSVKDENGDQFWGGILNFTGNECGSIELVY